MINSSPYTDTSDQHPYYARPALRLPHLNSLHTS